MINLAATPISGQSAAAGSAPPDDINSAQGFQSIIEIAFSDLMDDPRALQHKLEQLESQLDPELLTELRSLLETGNLPPTAAMLDRLEGLIQSLPARVEGELLSDEAPLSPPNRKFLDDFIQRLRDPSRQPVQLSRIDNLADSVRSLVQESSSQISQAFNLAGQLPEKFNLATSVDPEILDISATVRQAVAQMGEHLNLTATTSIVSSGMMPVSRPPEISQLTQSLPVIPMPPGEKGWDQAIGDRVLWMVGNKVQQAEVKINPPHLGPIDIKVSIQNEQASVSFAAQHAATREAIEAALPRLREMFGESNFNLVNVDVGQRETLSREGSEQTTEGLAGTDINEAEEAAGAGGADQSVQLLKSHGILDTYA